MSTGTHIDQVSPRQREETGAEAKEEEPTRRPRLDSDGNPVRPIVVVKIGSSSLSTSDGKFLNMSLICSLAETLVKLRKLGYDVILVTSGAVSIGCSRMRLSSRPTSLSTKQAIAAVGQSRLMHVYDDFFAHLDQPIAQVLLSRENLSKRRHYVNALNTFTELLSLGVVPIVNENDTTTVSALSVAAETVNKDRDPLGLDGAGPLPVEELRFGDNDTLSALVASLVEAEWLVLLTDVDALYTADPRKNPDAKPIRQVANIDALDVSIGEVGSWGTGGMATKLQAARIATACGVRTVIMNSANPGDLLKMIDGEPIGTQFLPQERPIRGKKKWIAHGLVPSGTLTLDEEGIKTILDKKSLLATGIVNIEGNFQAQSNVSVKTVQGKEVARGLINFSAADLQLIKGQPSREFERLLKYAGPTEVIHRENLVLLTDDPLLSPKLSPNTSTSSTASADCAAACHTGLCANTPALQQHPPVAVVAPTKA